MIGLESSVRLDQTLSSIGVKLKRSSTLFKAQGPLSFPWISSKSSLTVKNSWLLLSLVEKRPESQRQLSRLHSSWQNTGTSHPSAKELIKAAALLMINSMISSKQPELLAKFLHQIALMDVVKYRWCTLWRSDYTPVHWPWDISLQARAMLLMERGWICCSWPGCNTPVQKSFTSFILYIQATGKEICLLVHSSFPSLLSNLEKRAVGVQLPACSKHGLCFAKKRTCNWTPSRKMFHSPRICGI